VYLLFQWIRKKGLLRNDFYSSIVKKSEAQLKSYWSRLIFTDKGQAPTSLSGDASILEFVSGNLNAIGYVASGMPITNVKII
jgi:hypothetical protein